MGFRSIPSEGGLGSLLGAANQAAIRMAEGPVTPAALDQAARSLADVFAAGRIQIWLHDPSRPELHLQASAGFWPGSKGVLPIPTSDGGILVKVARTAAPWVSETLTRPLPMDLQSLATGSLRAAAVFPLGRHDDCCDLLVCLFDRALRPEHVDLLGIFATLLAARIETWRAVQREKSAADRTAYLQAASADLVRALTQDQVIEILVNQGLGHIEADAGFVAITNADGTQLEIKQGLAQETLPLPMTLSLQTDIPATEAVRTGKAIFIDSPEARAARYPAWIDAWAVHHRSWVVIPLVGQLRSLGVILMSFAHLRRFSEGERSFVLALAQQAGQSLERTRLSEERSSLLMREQAAHTDAEAERKRLHSLFLEAPVAISIHKGRDHVYELANPMYCQLVEDPNVVGKLARQVLPEKARLTRILNQVYTTGRPFIGKEIALKIDQTGQGKFEEGVFNFLAQPTRDANGNVSGVITFGVDVTEQVLARMKIEVLATDLSNQRRELARAVRVREDFLSIASHELRTPLTALQLQLQSLLKNLRSGRAGPVDDRTKGKVETAVRQADRLAKLIDELLDVSRLDAGRVDFQPETFDLAEVIRDVASRFQDELERARCQLVLSMDGSAPGHWDRLRLENVVTNLLANAIKYGSGGHIELSLSSDPERVRFSVRDQGIGIAPEHQERIFERFERAVSQKHYGGLGLGLWIVRQIVEAHRGTVSVDSQFGTGSTFTVELPRSPKAKEEEPGPLPVAGSLADAAE